ncbi:hypothetical protein [Anoxybacteroides rupiense]|uniref:hypothetical protein n=1 Tax=Anoxybacteroides rupiense TaxID=311460 RepID=UPI001F09CE92|nr:hypothetical protein [Anoxybacillus rupiensis]
MRSGNIEQFKHLSQFRDLIDFNNNIEQWMIDLKSKFTKSELIALKRLIRFSAKIPGVCNAKIQTLVSACHEAGQEISRSTFERMLRKAKQFGLVQVINTIKNGRKGHNVYVFQRYLSQIVSESSTNDVLQNEEIDVLNETSNQLKTSNQNNIKRTEALDGSFTSSRVPKEFCDLVKCFMNDYKVIEELWKVIQIQTYYLSYYSQQDKLNLAIDSFKQLVRNIKQGRKVRNIFGYFWGIVERKLDEEYKSILFEIA